MGACGALAIVAVATPAAARQAPSLSELQSEVEALRERERAANARVEALEARLRALESGLAGAGMVADPSLEIMRGRGATTSSAAAAPLATAPRATQVAQIDPPVDEPRRKTPAPTEAVETVSQAQQGQYDSRFTLEPGLSYSHFTNAQLNLSGFLALDAIFLGLISIDEVDADVVTADVTARYGLTDRLQLDLNVPWIYRRSQFKSGGAGGNASGLAEETVTANGLGDVSLGASYRLMRETAGRPDIVINGRVKAPTGEHPFGVELVEVEGTEGNLSVPGRLSTGSGVWGAAAGVSVLKTLDPMVVFGSLTYFHNFEDGFDDIDEAVGDQPGRVKMGDAIQYGAGVAFALNDTSSLSLSFTQRFVEKAELRRDTDEDWTRVIGSDANVGVLNLGATFSMSERLALIANVAAGLTEDAPDMVVSLRLPYRF